MCPLNDNCSCHEDDWTADPDHMCTDWELCPTCRLCVGCCTGGDDHPPASPTTTTTGKAEPMSKPENPSVQQYGVRWSTGSVFSYASREAAEAALHEDGRGVGVLVVHDIEPGTPNATEWREVEDWAMTETPGYAASVVKVLREHFPDLADPDVAEVATQSIEQQARAPQPGFEFIVDDPYSANWRLKAKPGRDSRHVRLRCYRLNRRQSDNDLEDAVNDVLRALETSAPRAGEEKQ